MSRFFVGNLFLLLSILVGAVSQVLLKLLLRDTGPLTLSLGSLSALGSPRRQLLAAGIVALLAIAFGFWSLSLSRLPVSYAYAVAGCSVIVVAILGILFLGEKVSLVAWIGILLIAVGSILLVTTTDPAPSSLSRSDSTPSGSDSPHA